MKKHTWSIVFAVLAAVMLPFCCQKVYAEGTLTSIVVKDMPTKTIYYTGDKLNTSGLVLRATFSDGTTQDISSGFTCTPQTFTASGEQNVTVTYSDKTAAFKVTVRKSLKAVKQPSSVKTQTGKTVSFTFVADGENVTYQWYYKKRGAGDWTLWKGHTTSATSAAPNATWNRIKLYCKAADAYGNAIGSSTVEVLLSDVVEIDKHPKNVTTYLNKSVSMSVTAYGENLSYQWYYKKEGETTWIKWKGKTSPTVLFTAERFLHKAKIRCVVTNNLNVSATSAGGIVTINNLLSVTGGAYNLSLKSGDNATFKVTTSGGTNVKYQWYIQKKGAADWTLWKGHTDAITTAVSNDTWSGMRVRCRVTDDSGDVFYSNTGIVTINGKLEMVESPRSQSVKTGENVSFTVVAAGNNMSYQWYYKKKGAASWSVWKGRTTATTSATANDSWNGMQVYCVVKDASGKSVSSSPATITIGATASSFAILSQPKSVTAKVGNSVRFEVKAQGDGLKYQWYYKKSGATSWSIWNGHTDAFTTADVNDTWNGMKLRCLVTDTYGSKAYTKEAVVTLTKNPIIITSQPQNVSIKANHLTSFSVSAKGEDLDYQWYYKKKGATGWSVWKSYATSAIQPPANNSWNGMQVRCKITDLYNNSIYSNPATITILPTAESDFRITKQPVSAVLYTHTRRDLKFSVDANGTGMTYQWYYCVPTEMVWKKLDSVSPDMTLYCTPERDGWQLYCVVTNGDGEQLYSDIARLTYSEHPFTVTSQPQNITTKAGKPVTFSVKANGHGMTYQWYYKKSGATNFSKWKGYASQTITPPSNTTWDGMQVRCEIKDAFDNYVNSEPATVTLISYEPGEFQITQQPQKITINKVWAFDDEYNYYYTTSITAIGTDLTYEWYISKNSGAWEKAENQNQSLFSLYRYKWYETIKVYCVVTNGDGEQIYSDIVTYSNPYPYY